MTDQEINLICRLVRGAGVAGYRLGRQEAKKPENLSHFRIGITEKLAIMKQISQARRKR